MISVGCVDAVSHCFRLYGRGGCKQLLRCMIVCVIWGCTVSVHLRLVEAAGP
jgi:hypothetical protein